MSNGRYSASVDQLSQHLLRSAARRRDQPSTRSPALRYWNLAQQRHYRRSAPCRGAMPVSGDCAARHGPHTRGKRPGFRPRQANSRERRTVCWREMDSNFQFRARRAGVLTGLYRRRPSKVFASPPKRPVSCTRDRWFESVPLQWRVGEPSVPQRGTFTPSSPYLKRPRLSRNGGVRDSLEEPERRPKPEGPTSASPRRETCSEAADGVARESEGRSRRRDFRPSRGLIDRRQIDHQALPSTGVAA